MQDRWTRGVVRIAVQKIDGLGDLDHELCRPSRGAAKFRHPPAERAAAHVLHREEGQPLVFSRFLNANDSAIPQLPQHLQLKLDFRAKCPELSLARKMAVADDLQC